ncbi:MAG: phosphatidate cytidylyltransferase [Chitinophagaceae bacterium]|nr:phosphatidate cytidylyltransferase [Chitinophagaceae bacterium]
MAFNWLTFRTRALTALVFVAVMLTGLLWNHWSFFILFSIIHFGCWIEYQKLVGLIDKGYQEITPFHQYGVMIAGWCIMLYFTDDAYNIAGFGVHEIGWWLGLIFVFALPIIELLFAKQVIPKNIGHSVFGLIYISLSLGLMMSLYQFKKDVHIYDTMFVIEGKFLPVIIIASIWINDTMAYIVGSLIGKTPLSKISPKKTWEGTIGGILLCIGLTGIIFSLIFDHKLSWASVLLTTPISIIASIAGTFGDLLESKLKRMAGVKDSGQIMPGHGGFLDRFDSLLLAIPFVWLYVYFFM